MENISKLRPNIFDVEKTFSSIFRNLNAAGRIGVIPGTFRFFKFEFEQITPLHYQTVKVKWVCSSLFAQKNSLHVKQFISLMIMIFSLVVSSTRKKMAIFPFGMVLFGVPCYAKFVNNGHYQCHEMLNNHMLWFINKTFWLRITLYINHFLCTIQYLFYIVRLWVRCMFNIEDKWWKHTYCFANLKGKGPLMDLVHDIYCYNITEFSSCSIINCSSENDCIRRGSNSGIVNQNKNIPLSRCF